MNESITKNEELIIKEMHDYTPPADAIASARALARARMGMMDDVEFAHLVYGLKGAYDLLDKLVFDEGNNALAGALEVIVTLCSVDNGRYYSIMQNDPRVLDIAIKAGLVKVANHDI